MPSAYNVAIVGITSAVGETILAMLAERDFPVATLFALDGLEGAGGRVEFNETYVRLQDVAAFDFSHAHIAFFCAGEQISTLHAPRAAAAGCIVIDDSAQFRYEADVPLVVPEVNASAVAAYKKRGIIANPNSCVTLLVVALKAIHDAVGIKRINVATYQAVSGMGKAGMDELATQATSLFNMKGVVSKVYPKQIAFNVLPVIGELLDNGYSREEMKMVWETRKILGDDDIQVNATCVRVPVFYGHSQAVHVETRIKITVAAARRLLEKSPGVKLMDGKKPGAYPTAVTEAAGKDAVYVGRLREDISHDKGLDLWIVADNVRKGAALNSIQIAEILVKDYLD
jgi:aspartate-semialdehyde dehydrogenase